MQTSRIDLPPAAPGTRRQLVVHRFGRSGARPKVYLQAALHADELPGVLVLHHLTGLLLAVEKAGRIIGEIVVVPVANPIGLAQSIMQSHLGRYDLGQLTNFNRGWPDLVSAVAAMVDGRLDGDPSANVALVRAALVAAADAMPEVGENAFLRRTLVGLAIDADIVLDLHCDLEAAMHVYLGTPLWPEAADLAAEVGAEAVCSPKPRAATPSTRSSRRHGGSWHGASLDHPSLNRASARRSNIAACATSTTRWRHGFRGDCCAF